MKKLPCKAYGCAERRIHWTQPYEERGTQYVEVPDDYPDERPVFCSLTCAILGGYMTAHAPVEICWKCLVAHDREIEHHSGYKCWEPDVTETQYQRAVKLRDMRRERSYLKFFVKFYYEVDGEMHTVFCHDRAGWLKSNPNAVNVTERILQDVERQIADFEKS
jgi:hypothetical protein